MEQVFLELNSKNLLTFRVENEVPALNKSEFLFQAKTMSALINNAWTVAANSQNAMKITPFKGMGIKHMFFEFIDKEDTDRLIEFKNQVYITPSHLELDHKALAMGLGIFMELNRDEDTLLPYLFKIKTAEVEPLEQKIQMLLGAENTIERNEMSKFYYLAWPAFQDLNYTEMKTYLQEAVETHNFNRMFSFMYGLILSGYATLKTQGIVFQIPTVKSLYINKDAFLQVFYYLKKYFVFTITEGGVTQIASKDGLFEEIMLMYMKNFAKNCSIITDYLKGENKNEPFKSCTALWHKHANNLKTKEALFDFLETIGLQNEELIEDLRLRKIKIHTK